MSSSSIYRFVPIVRKAERLRPAVWKIAPIMSRAASNFAKPQVSEEGVDANLLVSKDLAKMFEEIHQELESEIRYETELTDMSK